MIVRGLRSRCTRAGLPAGLALSALIAATPLSGQAALDPDLLGRCQAALEAGSLPAERADLCADVVAGIESLQPELGLLLAAGNPVLGTASPIGTKFGAMPRLSLGGRINFAWFSLPDLREYPSDTGAVVGLIDLSASAPQLDFTVGLFDGFDLSPSFGGVAAIEVLGSISALLLPADDGFQNDAAGYGLGARVGLLRESFTAPGVSVSGFYKWFDRVQYGSVDSGDEAQFGLDMSTWSFRAGISKSFVAFGFAVGVGWDRYESAVDYSVAGTAADPIVVVPEAAPLPLVSERWSAFVDASYIVLFFNIVAEAGWQEERAVATSGGREVSSGNFFGAIGMRLTP